MTNKYSNPVRKKRGYARALFYMSVLSISAIGAEISYLKFGSDPSGFCDALPTDSEGAKRLNDYAEKPENAEHVFDLFSQVQKTLFENRNFFEIDLPEVKEYYGAHSIFKLKEVYESMASLGAPVATTQRKAHLLSCLAASLSSLDRDIEYIVARGKRHAWYDSFIVRKPDDRLSNIDQKLKAFRLELGQEPETLQFKLGHLGL